jgi:hypothetical protein
MPIEPRNILETYFQTGDIPTAEQFKDLLDSYVHQVDDGVTVFPVPNTTLKYFGIGVENPQSRLGVRVINDETKSAIALYDQDALNADWYLSLHPNNNTGLSADEFTAIGKQSRLFIQKFTGNIGIGTTAPSQKLEIRESSPGSITGIKLLNTASLGNGIFIGHKQSSSTNQDGAFSIYGSNVSPATEFFTILQNGKTGIGTPDPDVRLHVVQDVALPTTDIDLIPGTGITVIGPMTNNLGVDYRGIQAREGSFANPADPTSLVLTASTLNLNRIAGDVLIHGDANNDDSTKILFTDAGSVGIGTITPVEKVDIDGALRIGTTNSENDGTIRFTGTDFEGFIGDDWVSLTQGMGPWKAGTPPGTIYYQDGTVSRVSIGSNTSGSTLDINDIESVDTGNTAVFIHQEAETTSSVIDDHRIGLKILNEGAWGGTPESKNIALFIPDVTGHTGENIAIAARGNILFGEIISGQVAFGNGAKNTLAIRASVEPATSPDTDTIQMYSLAAPSLTYSVFNVKVGNGDVIKLFKGAALPPKNTNPVGNDYTQVEAGVLNDTRNRLDALETFLKNLGLLP